MAYSDEVRRTAPPPVVVAMLMTAAAILFLLSAVASPARAAARTTKETAAAPAHPVPAAALKGLGGREMAPDAGGSLSPRAGGGATPSADSAHPNGYIYAVSCVSGTDCEAVGNSANSANQLVLLAQVWNGSVWSIQRIPSPPGGGSSVLDSVSCATTSDCEAVGYYVNSAGVGVTLAERWNGREWDKQSTPNPTGAENSSLDGVSCVSSDYCEAVGGYTDSSGIGLTLAEGWYDTAWSIQATPNPIDAGYGFLGGVSCPSDADCEAVGTYTNSFGEVTLAEVWDGTTWILQTTPNPTEVEYDILDSVSCSSDNECEAVGYYYDSSREYAMLTERWDGTTWTLQATPGPAGADDTYLYGVACAAGGTCAAVGQYVDGSGEPFPLAEGWDGSVWSVQTTGLPPGALGTSLYGTSCPSAGDCEAVGGYDAAAVDVTLAERWDGTAWMVQTTPNPGGPAATHLAGESCAGSTACEAVGNYEYSSGETLILAERWDGSTWKVQTPPNPGGATTNSLSGVSCPTGNYCEAVGEYTYNSSDPFTLAEVWNGNKWTIQATSNPAGALAATFEEVSCSSTRDCEAVGYYVNQSDDVVALAERWNGTGWTVQATPEPTGSEGGSLNAVSCHSATDCEAVGTYANTSGVQVTRAEVWNGSTWKVQAIPNPAGSEMSFLYGVSCHSTTDCEAVGYYINRSGVTVGAADVWNGNTWKAQVVPVPAGSRGNFLYGVSCHSSTDCEATGGSADNSGVTVGVGDVWNGSTWTVQAVPDPPGSQGNALYAVSCSSITDCEAVGSSYDSSALRVASAAIWNGSEWKGQAIPSQS